MDTFAQIADLAGMGAFSALVYFELRKLRESFERMAKSLVRLEERYES